MKNWEINFSIKYRDGKHKEGEARLEAENITLALGSAIMNIQEPMEKDPEVEKVVIWNVGIIEDDVF